MFVLVPVHPDTLRADTTKEETVTSEVCINHYKPHAIHEGQDLNPAA